MAETGVDSDIVEVISDTSDEETAPEKNVSSMLEDDPISDSDGEVREIKI